MGHPSPTPYRLRVIPHLDLRAYPSHRSTPCPSLNSSTNNSSTSSNGTSPKTASSPPATPCRTWKSRPAARLTVRESQIALFVDEGKIADVFAPGLYTLTTANLPLLTDLLNWDKDFESPFKSDVYFFSTRLQLDQKWGTATPITIRDKEFGAVRLRGYGIYSYRIADPRTFFTQVSGTRETYFAADLEGQLRDTIIARMTEIFATCDISFLDMTANQAAIADKIAAGMKPTFAALGLELDAVHRREHLPPRRVCKSLSTSASA